MLRYLIFCKLIMFFPNFFKRLVFEETFSVGRTCARQVTFCKKWRAVQCLLFLLLVGPVAGQAFARKELNDSRLDPSQSYLTIETPHFDIHYPEHLKEPALRVSRICEKVYDRVSSYSS